MKFPSIAVAAAIWLGAFGSASACQGTAILFQDSFDRLQPTWGEESDFFKVVDSQLEVSPAADSYHWSANSANLYDDIDMCVTMTTIERGRSGRSQGRTHLLVCRRQQFLRLRARAERQGLGLAAPARQVAGAGRLARCGGRQQGRRRHQRTSRHHRRQPSPRSTSTAPSSRSWKARRPRTDSRSGCSRPRRRVGRPASDSTT